MEYEDRPLGPKERKKETTLETKAPSKNHIIWVVCIHKTMARALLDLLFFLLHHRRKVFATWQAMVLKPLLNIKRISFNCHKQ